MVAAVKSLYTLESGGGVIRRRPEWQNSDTVGIAVWLPGKNSLVVKPQLLRSDRVSAKAGAGDSVGGGDGNSFPPYHWCDLLKLSR